jgi:hypothetical protein
MSPSALPRSMAFAKPEESGTSRNSFVIQVLAAARRAREVTRRGDVAGVSRLEVPAARSRGLNRSATTIGGDNDAGPVADSG